jgi:cell division protease FtsH
LERATKINIWYVLLALFGVIFLRDMWVAQKHIETILYSEFQTLLAEGKVDEIVIGQDRISGSYKDAEDAKKKRHFVTARVEPELAALLTKYKVKFTAQPESGLLNTLIGWLVPAVGFVLLWMFLIRPMAERQGGMMSIGKSRAKIYLEKDTKVTFADVAGVDEAKDELEEIVGFLKAPDKYGRLGARIPKGVLLVGPPGTGKTLLARAVAGEAGVPFFSISGSEFVEMFVGVGAARVRDLFEQARKHAPCIIFIDELDALGRARGTFNLGGGHDEKEQTLNQLLAELDGFDPSFGIVLLAATNRPEILDPALLRAGRFDRQVLVDRPDKKGRVDILKVHLRKIQLAADLDAEQIAALTPGFTGADLANLVNEAALLATRRGAQSVGQEDFTQAIERIIAGLEKKNRILIPREREVIAHHEMGHAIMAMAIPGSDPVQKVSIIPRGVSALGYTIQRPTEDRYLMTRSELENKIAVLLGGRAAESIVFDEPSTGAADDLQKATEIARSIVARFGMTAEMGQIVYESETNPFLPMGGQLSWQPRRYSEETATEIDRTVRAIVEKEYERAVDLLKRNRSVLDRGAKELLARETLTHDDLARLTADLTRETPGVPEAAAKAPALAG